MFICEHLTLDNVSFELIKYLKINGFETNQLKRQLEYHKISNSKASFNVIMDYEDTVKKNIMDVSEIKIKRLQPQKSQNMFERIQKMKKSRATPPHTYPP